MESNVRKYQEETGKSVHSVENQRILGKFVERNVDRNVSMLIEHFMQNPEALNGSDYDWEELFDLGKRIDWEEAVEDAVDNMSRDELVDYLEDRGFAVYEDEPVKELKDAVAQDVLCEDINYQRDFCENEDADFSAYGMEVLEYWIVDQRFREKLAEKGEATLEEFFGLPLWGRTTSGQAVAMDGVIAEIAAEMGILDGQSNSWAPKE